MMGTMMHRATFCTPRALLAVVAALALIACAGPANGGDPQPFDPLDPSLAYLTDVEAAERVQALKNDAISIGNGFVNGSLNTVMQGVPPSMGVSDLPVPVGVWLPVPHLRMWDADWTEPTLATGTFAFDEGTLDWTYSAEPADALIARWRSQTSDAAQMELRITWRSQVDVTYPEDAGDQLPSEVPTGWRAVLRRNGVALVDLDADFAFRTCDGVRMAEPTRLALSGFAGDGAARATVNELVVEAVGDDALRMRADLDLRSGSLELNVAASLSADVALERDTACWPAAMPETVELTGTLRVTGPGPLTIVRGDVTATYDGARDSYAVALRDGRFVSGEKRVDMVATIAAGEPDPASRLFLTFAGGVVRDVVDFVQTFGLAD